MGQVVPLRKSPFSPENAEEVSFQQTTPEALGRLERVLHSTRQYFRVMKILSNQTSYSI